MPEQSIAYVLMGYPRISELFIASEIARMEQQGTTLRLIVLKPSDEDHAPPGRRSHRGRAGVPAGLHQPQRPLVRAVAARQPARGVRADPSRGRCVIRCGWPAPPAGPQRRPGATGVGGSRVRCT